MPRLKGLPYYYHLSDMGISSVRIYLPVRLKMHHGKVTFCKVELTLTSVLSAIHRAICSAEKPRTCNSYVSPRLGFPFAGKLMKVGAEFMFSWIKRSPWKYIIKKIISTANILKFRHLTKMRQPRFR